MGVIVTYSTNKKVRVKAVGSTLKLLTLLVSTSKCLSEKMSKEKGVSLEEAENIVVNCIRDGMKVVN